jgi:hypothetical protein
LSGDDDEQHKELPQTKDENVECVGRFGGKFPLCMSLAWSILLTAFSQRDSALSARTCLNRTVRQGCFGTLYYFPCFIELGITRSCFLCQNVLVLHRNTLTGSHHAWYSIFWV